MSDVPTDHNPYPVDPTGFLVGSYIACILYGMHLTQVHTYFTTYSDPIKSKILVAWVCCLSTLQMVIIMGAGWKYFAGTLPELGIWGQFWWPLSFQDALIPIMAYTAQLYFGRRAWILTGRRMWVGVLWITVPTITLGFGISLAVTARLWANYSYSTAEKWASITHSIGTPSQIVAIVWMGLSATTDGVITVTLLYFFWTQNMRSKRLSTRLMSLTLETVLLTHICGAVMCIIFLVTPSSHRTSSGFFWTFLEIITELYGLSIIFTINARNSLRKLHSFEEAVLQQRGQEGVEGGAAESMCVDFGISGIERRVEGYQGDEPFGIPLHSLMGESTLSVQRQMSSLTASSKDDP